MDDDKKLYFPKERTSNPNFPKKFLLQKLHRIGVNPTSRSPPPDGLNQRAFSEVVVLFEGTHLLTVLKDTNRAGVNDVKHSFFISRDELTWGDKGDNDDYLQKFMISLHFYDYVMCSCFSLSCVLVFPHILKKCPYLP